jgi:hypothetical protein
MNQHANSSSSNFQEPQIQIQGDQPIFSLPTFSGSQDSSHDSQLVYFDKSQQPASIFDLIKLFEALERPLRILGQSQEA